jgi:Putative metal-binding motif
MMTPGVARLLILKIIVVERHRSTHKLETTMRSGTLSKIAATLIGLNLCWTGQALARSTGEAQGCGNCHYLKRGPTIEVTFSDPTPAPGDKINFGIRLQAKVSDAVNAGCMIVADTDGKFELVDPDTTKFAQDAAKMLLSNQVLHSAPRQYVDGKASFDYRWIAPNQTGVTKFSVFAISSTASKEPEEFNTTTRSFGIAHGCDGVTYYPDNDGDGFGDENNATLSCTVLPDLILKGGDCDDGDEKKNPEASEACNFADDDCNGEIDEGLEPGLYYADSDGDGVGARTAVFTCNDKPGHVSKNGDCKPNDPSIFPGAEELQNDIDDDCDGKVDELASDDVGEDVDGGAGRASGGCQVGGSGSPFGLFGVVVASVLASLHLRRRRKARLVSYDQRI